VELARFAELRELRVVTTRRRFSVKPPLEGSQSVTAQALAEIIEEEEDLLYLTLDREIARGILTTGLAELAFHHRLWQRVAQRGIIRIAFENWQT
jgi:hypothetical protein